jgi:hypothetical protein
MYKHACKLNVLINGRKVREYLHENNTYIEGRDGSAFEIEFVNNTVSDVEAVLSVDGISIIDGKPAGENSTGYVVRRFSKVSIPGWTLTQKHGAAFRFSGKKDASYAAAVTGSEANNGVIGAMVFKEKNRPPAKLIAMGGDRPLGKSWHGSEKSMYRSYGSTTRVTLSSDTNSLNNLGTEFGEKVDFKTTSVNFERDSLLGTLVLYYDSASGLTKRGIEVNPPKIVEAPNAFPASPQFCKPPSGWRE